MRKTATLLLLLMVVVVVVVEVLLAAAALVVGVRSHWTGVTRCPSSVPFNCTSSSAFNRVPSSR
jgi:hypothetical protein